MRKHALLSCALLFLLSAPRAHAALGAACERLLQAAPVSSHYTQKILDRATQGIAYAKNETAATDFIRYLPSWTRSIASGVLELIDTDLRLNETEEDLLNRTACLRFDLGMIECKMEEVRQELNTELARGSFISILRLQSLLSFLDQRYGTLMDGSLDPGYVDTAWNNRYLFDPPSDDPDPPEQTLCPFHSDYAPAMPSGFGCDLAIMTSDRAAAWQPMFAERAALDVLQTAVTEYRQATQSGGGLKNTLETVRQSSLEEGNADIPDHLAAFGCPERLGTCANTPSVRCNHDVQCGPGDMCIPPAVRGYCLESGTPDCRTNADCPRGDRCIVPQPVCSLNTFRACEMNADCEQGEAGGGATSQCVNEARTHIGLSALRGPFSVDADHLRILERFLTTRITEGAARQHSDTLKTAQEFPPGDQRSITRNQDNPVVRLQRLSAREFFRLFSAAQGLDEAAVFPAAVDAGLQTRQQGKTLRDALLIFNGFSRSQSGLRDFVVKLTYWIRRTCVFRPCAEKLDRALRIALEDACFPYANGDYLTDSPASPRFEQCAKQACIPLPGLELPPECDYLEEKP